jgi:hypothetical protein
MLPRRYNGLFAPLTDGDDAVVSNKLCPPQAFQVGEWVEAEHSRKWGMYAAAIERLNEDGTYNIRWWDGDQTDQIKTPGQLLKAPVYRRGQQVHIGSKRATRPRSSKEEMNGMKR